MVACSAVQCSVVSGSRAIVLRMERKWCGETGRGETGPSQEAEGNDATGGESLGVPSGNGWDGMGWGTRQGHDGGFGGGRRHQ